MRRLNFENMMPGDIALATSDDIVAKGIRVGTGSPISHAMLYLGGSSIMHAVVDGVQAENSQGIFFGDDWPVFVRRLTGGLPQAKADIICDHVRTHVGTQYSKREAIKAGLGGWGEASSRQFCSRLVAQAYDAAGYRLAIDTNYCVPNDLLTCDILSDVPNGTVKASNVELDYWKTESTSTVECSAAALTVVLNGIRKIDPSVQSFRDIGSFVMRRPECDGYVFGLLKSSGYLQGWRHDLDTHPWRYDRAGIAKLKSADVEWYCKQTLTVESGANHRYAKSLADLRQDVSRCPCSTLIALMQMYEKLVETHEKRVDAASHWLTLNGKKG